MYGVDVVSGPLSDELAGTTICAPCRVDLAERVRDGLLAALDALATEGPTADELAVALRVLRTNESDPALVPNLLFRQAFEHLIGRRSQPLSDSLALLEATSPERVAEILSEALETALLVLPDGLEPGDSRFGSRLEAFPRERPVAGQEFQRRGAWRGGARKELLIVGRNGVSHTMPGADTFTVRWETCAAVGTWKDGTRVLWSESGFVICVWPQLWRKGEKATGLIDEHVPSDMVIDMGDDPRRCPPRPVMLPLESVPNISDGRDESTLEALRDAFSSPARLLDVHVDWDHHRSVFTLVGSGEELVETLLRGIAAAVERIDLREHEGAHPRIGAADVVPLVPLEPAAEEGARGRRVSRSPTGSAPSSGCPCSSTAA